MKNITDKLIICILALLVIIALLWAGKQDSDLADDAITHHCEMVALYKSSRGELGWPNYNRSVCK